MSNQEKQPFAGVEFARVEGRAVKIEGMLDDIVCASFDAACVTAAEFNASVESRERAAWRRGAEAMRAVSIEWMYQTRLATIAIDEYRSTPLPAYEPAPTDATGKDAAQ